MGRGKSLQSEIQRENEAYAWKRLGCLSRSECQGRARHSVHLLEAVLLVSAGTVERENVHVCVCVCVFESETDLTPRPTVRTRAWVLT